MRRLVFAVPGNLDTPTGGYAYDRRVVTELRDLGWRVEVLDIGDSFPSPSAAELARAQVMLANAPSDVPIMIDGLAYGVMHEEAAVLARTHRLIALVHHPLALETGVSADKAASLRKSEREALALARHVISTSVQTAKILTDDYNVRAEKITDAPPGNDPMPMATGSKDSTCRLLSVGSIVPRKGYDVLIAALVLLPDLAWHLTIAGDETRSAQTTTDIKARIAAARLGDRVTLAGAVSDASLNALYKHVDIFVTSSHFEGYGMAATTAIACGLPVVATRVGAFSETIGDAGILVPPNDPAELASALRRVITNADIRNKLRRAAHIAARALPTWRETALQIARAVESVA
ncbi:MAG: glycosyltransferase family 4 protein [Xanthobacteraceae bacterium]